MRQLAVVVLALLVGAALAVMAIGRIGVPPLFGLKPEVASIADASLAAVRAQNRLMAFAARFTVDVTSTARAGIGLTAQKTMIVPGTVRYELDWMKLQPADLHWNESLRTLSVDLPAIELSEPQVEMNRIREYRDGRILMALTDAEQKIDAANRAQLRQALLNEARNPILLKLARDATRAAVERTFALPLAAAGVEARVVVRFRDEAGTGV